MSHFKERFLKTTYTKDLASASLQNKTENVHFTGTIGFSKPSDGHYVIQNVQSGERSNVTMEPIVRTELTPYVV